MASFRFSALTALLLLMCVGASPLLTGCKALQRIPAFAARAEKNQRAALRAELAPHLGVLGARNWIVIADPAYPILAGEGVDVVTVDADSIATLREVLTTLHADGSVTPRLWTCNELEAVPERRAPGVRRYRKELARLTRKYLHYEMTDHIISMQLTQAAQTYRILYIKTTTDLPYSSVAIELDSGYWNSDDEAELREQMEQLRTPATIHAPVPQVAPAASATPAAPAPEA